MIRVKFIAPYPAMVPLVEECKRNLSNLDISLEVGNLEEGIEIAKKAEADGYHVIISRGGTAQVIRDAIGLPVVDVHISGYDILRILTLAKDFEQKKALVGFTNITIGAQSIADLLDYSIDVYSIDEAEDLEKLMPKLKEEGYGLILGDVVTVDEAKRFGMEGVLLQSGREAIYDAFSKAENQYHFYKHNLATINMLTNVLGSKGEDLLVLHEDGAVVHEVWSSFGQLPISDSELKNIKQQVLLNGASNLIVDNEDALEVEVTAYSQVAYGEKYIILSFALNNQRSKQVNGLYIETVKQKPNIIQQSQAMNDVVTQLDHSAHHHQLFAFTGGSGVGKEICAKYIHYKVSPTKSFATIDLKQCSDFGSIFSSNIKTVYLKNLTEGDTEQVKTFIYNALREDVKVMFETKPVWLDALAIDSNEVVDINVPSLKERKEDLKGLVTLFMTEFHQELGTQPIKIRDEAIDEIQKSDWHGNVRELKDFIKTLVLSEKGYIIESAKVNEMLQRRYSQSSLPSLEGTLEEIEYRIIQSVLEEEDFNQSKAAKRLGINRSTLWRKLNK